MRESLLSLEDGKICPIPDERAALSCLKLGDLMGKTIFGTVVGIVVWMATALVLGLLLGKLWPAFVAASRAPLTLTTAMLAVRLSVSFIGSLASGATAARLGGMNAAIASGEWPRPSGM